MQEQFPSYLYIIVDVLGNMTLLLQGQSYYKKIKLQLITSYKNITFMS